MPMYLTMSDSVTLKSHVHSAALRFLRPVRDFPPGLTGRGRYPAEGSPGIVVVMATQAIIASDLISSVLLTIMAGRVFTLRPCGSAASTKTIRPCSGLGTTD